MGTRELLEWAAKYHTPNYARAPICLVRGDGVRVWDSDGKEYLDFGAGIAVASLGHCHPRVTGAIREAAATLLHVSNLYHTAPQIHLAKLLCDHSFADRVFFCNSGAEANEAALKLVRKYAKERYASDRYEVQTGVGRTGTLWAYEHSGIEPDVMTLAKALANGVPIGAMLTREEVARALGPGTHGSTFGGTPFVTSVALATLQTVLGEKIPERAARMGRRLMDGLRRLAQVPVGIREVRGRGLLIGGELDRPVSPILDACRNAGLLVLSAGENVLRLVPPLIIEEDHCDRALEIVDTALRPKA